MKSRAEIEQSLSLEIASALEASIRDSGQASLLVSGGSTPIKMFQQLSNYEINWTRVTISLVDERFVPKEHKDSNERLVREHLLQNFAKHAEFIPLVLNESDEKENLELTKKLISRMAKPFTVVVLGMGTDGHTASLFPNSPQLKEGMDLETEEYLICADPKTAPYQRISFTRKALLNTKKLFLHYYGSEKKEVLKAAKESNSELEFPILGFINQDKVKVELFWTN